MFAGGLTNRVHPEAADLFQEVSESRTRPGEAARGGSSSDGGICESSGCPAAQKRHPQPVLREESEETERGGLDEQRS